jgi:pyruvate kinase
MKKTKILCTIGPASISKQTLRKMIEAGMDAVRINNSHGDFSQYKEIVENVRAIKDIPIIMDTQGPRVRIYTEVEIKIKDGDIITAGFTQNNEIYFDFDFYKEIKLPQKILIDDGSLHGKIISKKKNKIEIKFLNSGTLKNDKGICLPNINLDMPILSNKDTKAIEFCRQKHIDFISLSFVRNKKDIDYVRKKINSNEIGIIAKIENNQALKNFDELLESVDGIMIARGDLGVQLPSESLPLIQKELIKKCNMAGKFVITATQMLQSMIENPTPTRAETSDVANAILDGTDVVMLSGETSVGKYPVHSVQQMAKIASTVESYAKTNMLEETNLSIGDAISHTVYDLTKHMPFDKIVILTLSGYTAKAISRYRIKEETIAIVPCRKIKKRIDLYFGITPVVYENLPENKKTLHSAIYLHKIGLLKSTDLVLFTAGIYLPKQRSTNLIQIHKMSELLEYANEHKNHLRHKSSD